MTHAPGQQVYSIARSFSNCYPDAKVDGEKSAVTYFFSSCMCVVTDLGEYIHPNDFQLEQNGIAKKNQQIASNSPAQKKNVCHFCEQKQKNKQEKHIFVFGLSCLWWITVNTFCPVIHYQQWSVVFLLVWKVH